MKKRILTVMLSALLILTLVPLSAGAYKFAGWTAYAETTIYASEFKEGMCLALEHDTTIILDTDASLCAIASDSHSLTVKDQGGHKLSVINDDGNAIAVDSLTLEGGTYDLQGNAGYCFGIHAQNEIVIDGADVTVLGSYEGIFSLNANITIKNSTVSSAGGYDTHASAISTNKGSIYIENSTVSAKSGGDGIYALGGDGKGSLLSVKNSNINTLGGRSGMTASNGCVQIESGKIESQGSSYGIAAYDGKESIGDIRISGGDIMAIGGIHGVYTASNGSAIITGGTVSIEGGIGGEIDISEYPDPFVKVSTTSSSALSAVAWSGADALNDENYIYVGISPRKNTHTVNVGALSVRDEPSADGARIGGLKEGDEVKVVAEDGEWSKIEYGTGYGWVMSKYLTPIKGEKTANTVSELYMTVSVPVVGNTPGYLTTCSDGVVVNITWYRKVLNEKNIEDWEEMPKTAKFQAGKEYGVVIDIETEDDSYVYDSKDNLTIHLDGSLLPKDKILSASGDALKIYKEYKLPEEEKQDTEAKTPKYDNPFVDVDEGDYYYDAVMWAYYSDPQVTKGVDETRFGPDSTVTRGQCVTFLWRAEGCPEPKSKDNPFTDVKKSDYYYDAILWAVENGITYGTTDTTFSPNATLTTQHIITFMYRCQNPGLDGWDGEAAEWAGKNYGGKPFGVQIAVNNKTDCPRWCVVQFLFELYVPRL
ncbi:MAG: S-layer homology domain-containing protein [Clostridia bacterium]|nr:S-layer homology domain-containing protein [Clostridia bacterium]